MNQSQNNTQLNAKNIPSVFENEIQYCFRIGIRNSDSRLPNIRNLTHQINANARNLASKHLLPVLTNMPMDALCTHSQGDACFVLVEIYHPGVKNPTKFSPLDPTQLFLLIHKWFINLPNLL